ncbi:MAG: alpha/beta hydrolase [Ignavibacteriaceae bacterium]|nr:alpha/beta hydrolase [Ignavibacteriaceae bacterium]
MKDIKTIKFNVSKSSGEVSGLLQLPKNYKALLLFAHGAGAPMNHPFMNNMANLLAEELIGTLRYNFPYTEKKVKRIDPLPILLATVKAAAVAGNEFAGEMPMLAGGKSMGGRMTSQAAASNLLEGVRGLVFFGFPLHAPGKESTERAEHLFKVNVPMLFLQGTRDKLANPDLLKPIITKLGKKAELNMIEGADHSFHLLKSAVKSDDEVLKELAKKVRDWIDNIK